MTHPNIPARDLYTQMMLNYYTVSFEFIVVYHYNVFRTADNISNCAVFFQLPFNMIQPFSPEQETEMTLITSSALL